MQIQVNSHQLHGSAELQAWVSAVMANRLERFAEFLTRLEVHLSDENAHKAGTDDKRCQIEARPKGHQPLSVSHKAGSLDLAVEGAADKMHKALEHLLGKLDTQVVSTGHLDDPLLREGPPEVNDAWLQQDFLARQEALGKE
ncbi:MAG: HPF/RaiA family ribosome-associated protein [Pseudomonadota bacterium]